MLFESDCIFITIVSLFISSKFAYTLLRFCHGIQVAPVPKYEKTQDIGYMVCNWSDKPYHLIVSLINVEGIISQRLQFETRFLTLGAKLSIIYY